MVRYLNGEMESQQNIKTVKWRNGMKVIVIGLDGGSFSVLKPLAQQGYMPNLAKLLKEGVHGELISCIPPVTGPAWASFLTGKQPGKHGIFDFFYKPAGTIERQPVNFTLIKSKTILAYLTAAQKKIGLVNVPLTYPPPKVNGFIITGLLTPSREVNFTYPPELKKEIEDKYGPYILDVFWQKYDEKTVHLFLKELRECEKQRINIALDLFTKEKPDFFMVVFTGTDRIQHALLHYIEPIIQAKAKLDKITKEILAYYTLIDEAIGKFISKIDEKTFLFLMSDHGFGPLQRKFYINYWLWKEGLLAFYEKAVRRYFLLRNLRYLAHKLALRFHLLEPLKKIIKGKSDLKKRALMYAFLDFIDWSKTKAFSVSGTEQGIYINVKGREPYGIVAPGEEYEKIRTYIIEKLKELKDPFSGQKLVSHIYKKEEVYHGPYADQAPDIIFFLRNGLYLADVQLRNYLWQEVNWLTGRGTHRLEGIFMAYGQEIKKGQTLPKAHITDLAPTILYALGMAIPTDMDGRVLKEIFKEEFTKVNPVIKIKDDEKEVKREDFTFSQEEKEEVLEKLKDLGYL